MKRGAHERRIDKNREILASTELPPAVEGRLKSAFPVRGEWLEGAAGTTAPRGIDVEALASLLEGYWERLVSELGIERSGEPRRLRRDGVVRVSAGGIVGAGAAGPPDGRGHGEGRRQLVRAELRSAGIDGVTFLRCSSEIGLVDLPDGKTVNRLRRLVLRLGQPRLCARYQTRHRKYELSVDASVPFEPTTTQYEEVRELVRRVARQADRLEHELLGVDAEPTEQIGTPGRV